MEKKTKLSTESYKGVRDFYPEDMFIQNYIFKIMSEVPERFGYVEYTASLLEPAELYKAKSGEEIVNDQTYTFTDRGERKVTLRPEMTPTVARLVAARKRELAFPLRWYSIPNLFRYERPQRGRLREHWQLNVDIFGILGIEADAEIIKVAYGIMEHFGIKDEQFKIRLSSRKIINALYEKFNLEESEQHKLSKLIDKKNKITEDEFLKAAGEIFKSTEEASKFASVLQQSNLDEIEKLVGKNSGIDDVRSVSALLEASGIKNIVFDATLMRGFDYYTDIVFEVFDTSPENNRSLFGGGRYNDLLDIFGGEKVPAVGFGMGDVTIRDVLETYKLLPEYVPSTRLYVCVIDEMYAYADSLAEKMRTEGIAVAVDYTRRALKDQMRTAEKQLIPFVVVIGNKEQSEKTFKIKNLKTGIETTFTEDITRNAEKIKEQLKQ